MPDHAHPHAYTHSRILHIIPVSAPTWVVYHFRDRATNEITLDVSPVMCWALVEEWTSPDYCDNSALSARARREDSSRLIRPVTQCDEGIEPDDAANIVMVTTEWPCSDATRAAVIASLTPRAT